MKGKFLVRVGNPYHLTQINRIGKTNYITSYGKINKTTMLDNDPYPSQWKFATDEDIKNYENFLKQKQLNHYNDTLNEILKNIEKIKDCKYLNLSDDIYIEIEETIIYIKEELTGEQI